MRNLLLVTLYKDSYARRHLCINLLRHSLLKRYKSLLNALLITFPKLVFILFNGILFEYDLLHNRDDWFLCELTEARVSLCYLFLFVLF